MKIALFSKKDKPTSKEVIEYLLKFSNDLIVYHGQRGDKFPKEANSHHQDILVSYLSPWIIPKGILDNTKLWNINFHGGPPEYPGIGCFNFAIYNQEKTYGVTAHLMNEKVDTGKIISVKRFPLLETDSVLSLSLKSYKNMLDLFFEVMNFILKENKLPHCDEEWRRVPYTRRELEDLCRLDSAMAKDEVARRIKSTTYPDMPGAYLDLHGHRFKYALDRKNL